MPHNLCIAMTKEVNEHHDQTFSKPLQLHQARGTR